MTAKARREKNTLLAFTNGDFSQIFDRQWAGFPRGIGCHRVPGFISPMALFVHDNINSKEVCWVFVLHCQFASNPTCPVLFYRVTCHMQIIWSFKSHSYIHTCMHSCIQTSILSYIHTFKRAQRTHTHTMLIHTWLHRSPKVSFGHITSIQPSFIFCLPSGSPTQRTAWGLFSVFQVVSPTQRTAWGLFFCLPSGYSYTTDSLRFIFLSSKRLVLHNGQLEVYFSVFQVVSPTQRTAWGLFSVFQVVSPTQRTAWGLFFCLPSG